MKRIAYVILFAVLVVTACSKDEPIAPVNEIPVVKAESSFTVLKNENITYAEGLIHNNSSTPPLNPPP